jgi:hypothetical protein
MSAAYRGAVQISQMDGQCMKTRLHFFASA